MKVCLASLNLLALLITPLAFGEDAASAYVPEPLLLRSEALGQIFRSSPLMQRFRLGQIGEWRIMAGRSYSNFWAHDKRYIIDTETRDDQLRVYYQAFSHLELYAAASERAFTRMGTDGMAIGFHNLFGLPQDGRLDAPRENVRLSIPDYDLNYSLAQKNDIFSRQFEAGFVWDFASQYALSLPMTFAFYTTKETAQDNPYFTGATDAGMRLSAALPYGDFSLYGTLSFTVFDGIRDLDVSTNRQQWGTIGGGAYRFAEDHEAFLQFLVYQPLFRQMGQLSRNSYEVHLAYRYQWDELSFELGLIENVFWVYNSPDWGLSTALTYHPF